jgi:hypothetical protein
VLLKANLAIQKGGLMDSKLISIKNGAREPSRGDRRCKRTKCLFPDPTVRFDLTGPRMVAVWSWFGVEMVDAPNGGMRVSVLPVLLLVPISRN